MNQFLNSGILILRLIVLSMILYLWNIIIIFIQTR